MDVLRGRRRTGFPARATVWIVVALVPAGWFFAPGCDGRAAEPPEVAVEAADEPVSGDRSLAQNLIVVSIDTLRADRIEPYGSPRPTSPSLSALALRSVVFTRAQSQSSQTAPSHASLFTSEYGETHGIVNVHGDSSKMRVLPAGLSTLAEVAQRSGLETAAFVSNGNLTRGMGMSRGFDVWDEKNEDMRDRLDRFVQWIEAPGRGRFFGLFHTYQVHAPYVPPQEQALRFIDPAYSGPLRARLERYWTLSWDEAWSGGVGADYWNGMLEFTDSDVRFLSDLYDGEVAYADGVLRRLVQEVLTGSLAGKTALIVLSDHGEEFRDHGKFQHDQLFEELIRVPLLIHVPEEVAGLPWTGAVADPVELVDVAPTAAELLGIDARHSGWEGKSLVPLLDPLRRATAADPDRAQFSELTLDPGPKQFRSVTWRGWKYIHGYQQDLDATWEWLFDLSTDPGERKNRLNDQDAAVAGMLAELRRRLEDHSARCREQAGQLGGSESVPVSEEHRRELEQLGYVR